jgi:hypothetical protein
MKLNFFSALALPICIAFACQTEPQAKKEARKVKEEVAPKETEVQAKALNPTDTAFILSGADSVLISKKKVVEKWDKEWSKITYQIYDETAKLEKWQLAINHLIRNSLYKPEEQAPYTAPLNKELFHQALLAFKKESKRYDEDEMNMVWGLWETYQIAAERPGFATLKSESSTYQGGAHGSYGVGYYHFDKKTAKEIHLKDFFNLDKKFLQIAEAAFRKAVGISQKVPFDQTDFWFEKGFSCPDNFDFSNNKVTFYYNQYEVAPYSYGTVSFSLSLKQIQPYLKREI